MYFALAYAGWVTWAVPLVMTARDIIVAYTRVINAMTGNKVSARLSGKIKAIIQGGGVPVLMGIEWMRVALDPLWSARLLAFGTALLVGVTLWSLVDYVVGVLPAVRIMLSKERR